MDKKIILLVFAGLLGSFFPTVQTLSEQQQPLDVEKDLIEQARRKCATHDAEEIKDAANTQKSRRNWEPYKLAGIFLAGLGIGIGATLIACKVGANDQRKINDYTLSQKDAGYCCRFFNWFSDLEERRPSIVESLPGYTLGTLRTCNL